MWCMTKRTRSSSAALVGSALATLAVPSSGPARRRLGGRAGRPLGVDAGHRARPRAPSPCTATSPTPRACARPWRGRPSRGAVDLVVNAASAYGGTGSGPFGGGLVGEAAPDAFDDWAAAPAARPSPSCRRRALRSRAGAARDPDPGHRPLGARAMPGAACGRRRLRRARDHAGGGARAARAGHRCRAAHRRRRHRALEGGGREGWIPRRCDPREIADAVIFLADQGARAATHELQVTPLAERWSRSRPSGPHTDRLLLRPFAADRPRGAARHRVARRSRRASSTGTRARGPRVREVLHREIQHHVISGPGPQPQPRRRPARRAASHR